MTRRIFIFNPETDYALAAGRNRYNVPATIAKLRGDMQLIQARLASTGDCILVSPDFSPERYPDPQVIDYVRKNHIRLLYPSEIADCLLDNPAVDKRIVPWGWNHSLRQELLELGFDKSYLKSEEEIDTIRTLSHRRTTIPFQQLMQNQLPYMNVPQAKELTSVDEAMDFLEEIGSVFFKAPWSSSGRGILKVKKNVPGRKNFGPSTGKLKEWLSGFVKRQGSVMGERAFVRVADFATEWLLRNGKAEFLGLSLFNTTPAGKYVSNESLSQEEMNARLSELSPLWTKDIIEAQRVALETLILPSYSGPVGIDMLIDSDGNINPCVEINLRLTMGMVALGSKIQI